MGMEGWQKLLLAAGGAAAAGTILYLLFTDEPEGESASTQKSVSLGQPAGGISKAELIEILKELSNTQKEASSRMKVLAQSMAEGPELSFDELYNKVKASEPADSADPLERRGMTTADLDGPLQANQNDMQVMMAFQEMMSGGAQAPATGGASASLTVEKLTEVNRSMVDELKAFITSYNKLQGKEKYDWKMVMNCLQASLDAKLFAKYGLSQEDLQAATMANQQEIAQSKDFIASHEQMQTLMQVFVKQLQEVKQ